MSKLELLDFIATEATHDSFYNMVDLIDKKKGNFDLKELIDELGKKCRLKETKAKKITPNVPSRNNTPSNVFKNSFFAKNIGISEFKMDEILLGKKRQLLCSSYKNKWSQIKVRSLDYNTMKVSDKTTAEIQHFPEIACNRNDSIMINNMFSKVNVKDIYFVCDSASELIGKFSVTPYFPNNINVHVMISSSTLADPSSRITRKSRHTISVPKKANKYIHTYQVPINLKKCDKFGLLDFKITHNLKGNSPDYHVEEIFEYSDTGSILKNKPIPLQRIFNPANIETAKKLIQCEIGKGKTSKAYCGKSDGIPAKFPFFMDKRRGLRIAQYKRMGDHQQIRFIRWLWDKKNFEKSQELYHSNSKNIMHPNPNYLNSLFNKPSPNNCYFVTGDYPAFEYAIFHRINAIIKTSATNGTQKGILMVRFN